MSPLTAAQFEALADPVGRTIPWADVQALKDRDLVDFAPDVTQPYGWRYWVTPTGALAVRVYVAWRAMTVFEER